MHELSDAPPLKLWKPPKRPPRLSDVEYHNQWAPIARAMFHKQHEATARLARELGVSAWALDALKVGYGQYDGACCWSIPERNHKGFVVGIACRYESGKKGYMSGGRRGLVYAEDFLDYEGPIFIVEGMSDTAAGLMLGLCVVGRPNNIGGIVHLRGLLQEVEPGRRIVVLVERDKKRHEELKEPGKSRHHPKCRGCSQCWPGEYGAKTVAAKLREQLRRRVEWWALPDKAKDLRAWCLWRTAEVMDERKYPIFGRELYRRKGEA